MNAGGGFTGVDIPGDDLLAQCMHCGLCLPTCPTYALTGMERSSPRGRIRLIKAVAEGELPISDGFIHEMEFCLDCQACETACPAGVKYGSLVESARAQIFQQRKGPARSRMLKGLFLGTIFSSHARLKALAILMRWYQRSGMAWFLSRSGILNAVSPALERLQPLAPKISDRFSTAVLDEVLPAYGERRYKVGFLTGCLMDVAFSDVNLDTVELLRRHGCEVHVPPGQSCCGSLAGHNGDLAAAREMARRIVRTFAALDVDFLVMNSAGCGAFVKEYGHVFAGDAELKDAAARVSARTLDITEFLARTGYRPRRTSRPGRNVRVVYHDACHLAHTQRVTTEPRSLLSAIPGIDLVELSESTWCCGSAGIYNVTQNAAAMALLDRKVDRIAEAAPEVLVTGNPGCLIQIGHGLEQRGLRVRLVHTATFLREMSDPEP